MTLLNKRTVVLTLFSWALYLGAASLFPADIFAAGPKISGSVKIVDDLPTGSGGHVASSSGAVRLSGSFGQFAQSKVSDGTTNVHSGYFAYTVAPTAPSGFTGTAKSLSSIEWSWADNSSNEDGFRVMDGAANLSGDLAAGATFWVQTGLSTNAQSGPLFARAFNGSGTADSGTDSVYSLADAPTTLAFTGINITSVSISWSAATNPGGTNFQVQRDSGTGFTLYLTTGATSLDDTGLTPGGAISYRIRALNGDSVVTGYSNTISTTTSPAPGGCGATASTGSGNWSAPATWSLGAVPSACSAVTIAAGHTVSVDMMTAAASTMTLNGTLAFSRVAGSSLTLVGGDLTVEAGGTLDMGTSVSPIPTGVSAHLILAFGIPGSGSGGVQYGLIVNDGGNFTVRGATKTPYALALADALAGATSLSIAAADAVGWTAGDAITIGKTERSNTDQTEQRTITGITGTDPKTVSWSAGLSYNHYSARPLIVGNLTRNVLVRSSGTKVTPQSVSNSAYIRNLTHNATSFNLAYGEFAYLGSPRSTKYGLVLTGSSNASISSSTIRDGYDGIVSWSASVNHSVTANNIYANAHDGMTFAYLSTGHTIAANNIYSNTRFGVYSNDAHDFRLISNYFYGNSDDGIALGNSSSKLTVVGNKSFANKTMGIDINDTYYSLFSANEASYNSNNGIAVSNSASFNTLDGNISHSNGQNGIILEGEPRGNTLISNNAYSNLSIGLALTNGSEENLLVSNNSYSNLGASGIGFYITGSPENTLIGNNAYSNSRWGLYVLNSTGNVVVAGGLGYDPEGSPAPNSIAELAFAANGSENLVLKRVRVNPTLGVANSGFNRTGNYLLSYHHNLDTGTLRLWGDYEHSGGTLTLDYSTQLYASTATAPKVMRGTASVSAVSVDSTDDSNALSQLITVTFSSSDSLWHVVGSSSGELGTLPPAGGTAAFPSGAPQFDFTLAASGAQHDDRVDFALLAASQDGSVEKKLLIADSAPAFNGGRSKLTIAPSGGFVLRGVAGTPSIMDRLDASSTYYSFVSSGSFTSQFATIGHTDPLGLQLSGSAGVAISSTAFTDGTGAYITARELSSTASMPNVAFSTAASAITNVSVSGSDAGLSWLFPAPASGALWGEDFDFDPNCRVSWAGAAPKVSAGSGNWSDPAIWSPAGVPMGCDRVTIASGDTVTVDTLLATASTTTIEGTLLFSRVANSSLTMVGGDLIVNSGGILDMGTEASPIPAGIQAHLVLAYAVLDAPFNLLVNNGGGFTVRGASKSIFGIALGDVPNGATSLSVPASSALGWAVGDVITIGPGSQTEERVVTSITGTDPKTLSWSGGLSTDHNNTSTTPIVVANLSRNVLVRSSGTKLGYTLGGGGLIPPSVAQIKTLTQDPAGFSLRYGDFAHLRRIQFDGPGVRGQISSSTIRNGGWGIYADGASHNVFSRNLIYKNSSRAISILNSSNNLFDSNHIYANSSGGIHIIYSSGNIINSNHIYSNGSTGLSLVFSYRNSLSSNSSYANGYEGIYLGGYSNTLAFTNVYSNSNTGIVTASSNTLISNTVRQDGIKVQGDFNLLDSNIVKGGKLHLYTASYNTLISNEVSGSSVEGIYLQGGSGNTLQSNRVFSNGSYGVRMWSSNANIFVANDFFSNTSGVYLYSASSDNTFLANNFYSNSAYGLYGACSCENTVFLAGNFGYDKNGVSLPNSTREIEFSSGGDLTLKQTRINPAADAVRTYLLGGYVLSYEQNYDTGTVRLWGNYTVSAENFVLDYATQLYASTTTLPKVMRGTSINTVAVNTTNDGNALSQLITVTFDSSDGLWHVAGSSSGELGTLSTSGGTADFPSASPQFNLSLSASAAEDGDQLDFVLIAASKDAGVQKKLFFGNRSSDSPSRLMVAPDAGFILRGIPGAPAIMDRLDAASTYYAFLSSGSFSVEYASITNTGPRGIELSGTAGVSIASTTFDFMGFGAANNSYITVRDLTSQATFFNIGFGISRSSAGAPSAYNVHVEGSDTGLDWVFRTSIGALWGEAFDDDPNGKVYWAGPQAPSAFTGTALSSVSIRWSWSDNSTNEDGYRVMDGAVNISGDLAADTTSWDQTGLSPNTLSSPLFVQAIQGTADANSNTSSVYTLANPPAGSAASAIYETSATITWNLNGNPAATFAQVERSSDNAGFFLVAAGSATSSTNTGLFPCTTYYYRVRNIGAGADATAYDATLTVVTLPAAPLAPSGFIASSLPGARIALSWNPPVTPDIQGYRVYFDSGAGTIDYGTPLGVVASSMTSFITGPLASGTSYQFGIRATCCGLEEQNTSVMAAAYALTSISGVRARIAVPFSGKTIAGNRVLIMAELSSGDPGQTKEILFEYKASSDAVWVPIVAANIEHLNPDTSFPYFVHWDVDSIPVTTYDLRAVAKDISDVADPAPEMISIAVVAPANADTVETSLGAGRIQKDQKLHNTIVNEVESADEGTSQTTGIRIPPGALSESSVTVRIVNRPALPPADPADLDPIGVVTEITLQNGQTQLAGSQTAAVTISYPDVDDNGIVDGTSVRAADLVMYTYDTVLGEWVQDFASTVNLTSHTVTGNTPHFSFFALFATPQTTAIIDVRVYPNPFKPNDGNPDTGVGFSAGNAASGVIFDQLPQNAAIKIYTITGQRVAAFTAPAGATMIQWDARNDRGRDVASGLYLAVISSPGQQPAVRKILVIR